MQTATLFLSVLSTLAIITNFLTLVAIGKLRRDHDQQTTALIDAHNIVANRVSNVGDFTLTAATALLPHSGKSNQGGHGQ